jgi:hypothetical protein
LDDVVDEPASADRHNPDFATVDFRDPRDPRRNKIVSSPSEFMPQMRLQLDGKHQRGLSRVWDMAEGKDVAGLTDLLWESKNWSR